MGFHKRYIDDDQIIELYRHSGNEAVMDLFTKGVDAIISTGELTSDILDLTLITENDKWNKISELISEASIKKGFK
jgi:hypothetical protein